MMIKLSVLGEITLHSQLDVVITFDALPSSLLDPTRVQLR
jgi:hypothetical protein